MDPSAIPPLITAHIIMKDEAEVLPRCLASLQGVVDEICIVDTGSTDGSIEMARQSGARVIEHPWTDSFSEARNAGLDAAQGQWILHIDADEELQLKDGSRLRALLSSTEYEALMVEVLSYEGEERPDCLVRHEVLRIWRNRSAFRFRGLIHEGLTIPGVSSDKIARSDVQIRHYGYVKKVMVSKRKSERNLSLLQKELQQDPTSPYWHFYIGSEYMNRQEYEVALHHFDQAVAHVTQVSGGFVPLLFKRRVVTTQILGRHELALSMLEEAHKLFPGYIDLWFLKAESLFRTGRLREALRAFKTCTDMNGRTDTWAEHLGVEGFKAYWWIGEINQRLGRIEQAQSAYRQSVLQAPHFRPAWEKLIGLLREERGIEQTLQLLPLPAGEADRLTVAQAFWRRGDYPAVVTLLDGTTDSDPTGDRRYLLGSAHVRMGWGGVGVPHLHQIQNETLQELVHSELVLNALLTGDVAGARREIVDWEHRGGGPEAIRRCRAICSALKGEMQNAADALGAAGMDEIEGFRNLLAGLFACGADEDLHALERLVLGHFGPAAAAVVAALYEPGRWSRRCTSPAPDVLRLLWTATRERGDLSPEDWISLARLFRRSQMVPEALTCYLASIQADACRTSPYLEAADLLVRRAIDVG